MIFIGSGAGVRPVIGRWAYSAMHDVIVVVGWSGDVEIGEVLALIGEAIVIRRTAMQTVADDELEVNRVLR